MYVRNIDDFQINKVYQFGSEGLYGEYREPFYSIMTPKLVQVKTGEYLRCVKIWDIPIPSNRSFNPEGQTLTYIVFERLLPRVWKKNKFIMYPHMNDESLEIFRLDAGYSLQSLFEFKDRNED